MRINGKSSHRRILLIALLPIGMAGCAVDPHPLTIKLSPQVERPARSALVFFVDGLDETRFNEMLGKGELPNIGERFVRRGVRVDNAITSMPSITYPNAVALITGRFPGHHGILGNRWFDPRTLEMPDYMSIATYRDSNEHFSAPTLYELLTDRLTVNIQDHTRRGATYTFDNVAPTGVNFYLGMFKSVDARSGSTIEQVGTLANRVKRWPSVIMTYYPGNDEIGHRFGSNSPEYAWSLLNIDAIIGEVFSAMDEAKLTDQTTFVLCSDHGHVPSKTTRRFNVQQWLEQHRGRHVIDRAIRSHDYAERYRILEPYDTVVVNGAYRRSAVHCRGPRGWGDPPVWQQIRDLIFADPPLYKEPAIEAVLTPETQDRTRLISRFGNAVLERRREAPESYYRVAEIDGNPMHYRDDPTYAEFVDAGWHTSRDWLNASAGARYPDFVPQAVEMFDSPRAWSVVLLAADDWTFGREDLGGHGSCLARDMRIPMYFTGPGLPQGGHIRCARLVDIMPTLVDLLGERERLEMIPAIDGVSLRPQLEAATPIVQQAMAN